MYFKGLNFNSAYCVKPFFVPYESNYSLRSSDQTLLMCLCVFFCLNVELEHCPKTLQGLENWPFSRQQLQDNRKNNVYQLNLVHRTEQRHYSTQQFIS